MADSQRELKFKITTDADLSGVKATGQELNNLSEQTKEYSKKLEAQDEQEKKGIASKGEIRRGLREIGRELPILGELGRMAMEPLIGAFVMLSSVVSAAFEGIKEMGNRSVPEFNTLTDAVEKQEAAVKALEASYAAVDRAIERVSTATQTVQDRAKEFQSALSARHGADESLLGKTHDRDIAELQAAEELGLITHEQYIIKKLALDEAYFKKRMDLENKFQFDQMKGKAQERFSTDMEARTLERGLKEKRATAEKAAGAEEFAKGKVTQTEENLKKTEEKLKQLQEEHGELTDKTTGWGKFTTLTPQVILEQRKAQNEHEQIDQMNEANRLRQLLEKDKKGASAAKERAAETKEDVDEDQQRLRKDRERVHQLDLEAPGDLEKYKFDKSTRQQEFDIESQTHIINATKDISAANNKHGEVAASAAEIAARTAAISTSMADLGNTIVTGHGDLKQQIDDVKREVEILTRRSNSGASGTTSNP